MKQQSGNVLALDLESILERTRDSWERLRGERIFITGGTGFVGSWLLESFAWANDRLSLGAVAQVLTRNPAAFVKKAPHLAADDAIQLTVGDVRQFAFPPGEFGFVIHAATAPNPGLIRDTPGEVLETIIGGTRRTLEMALACRARRFLFTSSGAVYGPQPAHLARFHEDYRGGPDPTDPLFAYGEGKRDAELLCRAYARSHGLSATIARCFTFVGPYLPLNDRYAVGNFVSDRLRGEAIRVRGDGTARRSFLYTSDLAIWLWTLLFRGASDRSYNVGSEEDVSIRELAEVVAATGDKPPCVVLVESRQAPGAPVERYVPSTRRVAEELGLVPTVALREGLARMFQWHTGRT